MARPSRNSCTAYALRNYSQKDVLNVQVTEASVHAVLDCSSVRRTSFLSTPNGGGAQKRKRYEIGCQILLITNRKSHTGFRLVPTSMTLNDFNGAIALFCVIAPNLIALQADYVIVVEDRPIVVVKYCFPVPVFHFWP